MLLSLLVGDRGSLTNVPGPDTGSGGVLPGAGKRALPSCAVPPFVSVPADAPLRLLTVHAHPDDEASKGASTVAALHAGGVHCVLVCCTGGEAGDVLNPAMDVPEVHADLPAVRNAE